MKIICVNSAIRHLTIGKVYDVITTANEMCSLENNLRFQSNARAYRIIDDYGNNELYSKTLFVTVEEFRDMKINDILR
jgi:phosphopantothenate synthetase